MENKRNQIQRLYSKVYNSYAEWNGSAWEDNRTNAYFHSLEKAANNTYYPEKSTRELALEWWNNLKDHQLKQSLADDLTLTSGQRAYQSLTDKEIEEIWRNELCLKAYGTDLKSTKQEDVNFIINPENHNVNHKPNQKQFKEFNPELFQAYIDKFSDEGLEKAKRLIEAKLFMRNLSK